MKFNNGQEIELKLRINDKADIVKKLFILGATSKGSKRQQDILYNSKYYDLGKYDHALRLRSENGQAVLTFKGTPSYSELGHRTRDEFETPVLLESMEKILEAIGFIKCVVLDKKREEYSLGNLEIVIDEFPFGTFLELEGEEKEIEELRKKLRLVNAEPVRQLYVDMQLEWEKRQT